jgi:hypothetical protein
MLIITANIKPELSGIPFLLSISFEQKNPANLENEFHQHLRVPPGR